MIEPSFPSQRGDLFEKIFAQGAANAPVGHLDQFFLRSIERGSTALYQRGVNVHLAHVIDDDRHAATLSIVEDMIEQRGLAGAQESGEHGNG